jgi:hypothetical protein
MVILPPQILTTVPERVQGMPYDVEGDYEHWRCIGCDELLRPSTMILVSGKFGAVPMCAADQDCWARVQSTSDDPPLGLY